MNVNPEKNGGFVLLATLWVMVMLGIIVTTLSFQVRVEASVERYALDISELRLGARGAVHLAAARLAATANSAASGTQQTTPDHAGATGIPDSEWQDIKIGRTESTIFKTLHNATSAAKGEANKPTSVDGNNDKEQIYGPDDGESRLNINVARPEQLTGFPGVSTVMAESIARYRRELQPDSSNQRTDETDNNNNSDDNTIQLMHEPIVSLQQLLSVEGMTESLLFEGTDTQPPLAQHLTTLSSGKVNINTATEEVLLATGFNDADIKNVLARRESNPFSTPQELQDALGLEADSKKWQRLQETITTQSSTYSIISSTRLPDTKQPFLIRAVLFNDGESMRFVRWQER